MLDRWLQTSQGASPGGDAGDRREDYRCSSQQDRRALPELLLPPPELQGLLRASADEWSRRRIDHGGGKVVRSTAALFADLCYDLWPDPDSGAGHSSCRGGTSAPLANRIRQDTMQLPKTRGAHGGTPPQE